jgi:hypothetical protein
MRDSLIEAVIELSIFLLYGVATAILAVLGALFEYRSYLVASSGETAIALWVAGLGAVLLVFAYRIGRDKMADLRSEMQIELL